MNTRDQITYSGPECRSSISAVRDALYVLNGKWKLPIIASLSEGPQRFNELLRTMDGITPRVLSKELRELELNELVRRNVLSTIPATVTYSITPYSGSLSEVLGNLRAWGEKHKQRILASRRAERQASTISI